MSNCLQLQQLPKGFDEGKFKGKVYIAVTHDTSNHKYDYEDSYSVLFPDFPSLFNLHASSINMNKNSKGQFHVANQIMNFIMSPEMINAEVTLKIFNRKNDPFEDKVFKILSSMPVSRVLVRNPGRRIRDIINCPSKVRDINFRSILERENYAEGKKILAADSYLELSDIIGNNDLMTSYVEESNIINISIRRQVADIHMETSPGSLVKWIPMSLTYPLQDNSCYWMDLLVEVNHFFMKNGIEGKLVKLSIDENDMDFDYTIFEAAKMLYICRKNMVFWFLPHMKYPVSACYKRPFDLEHLQYDKEYIESVDESTSNGNRIFSRLEYYSTRENCGCYNIGISQNDSNIITKYSEPLRNTSGGIYISKSTGPLPENLSGTYTTGHIQADLIMGEGTANEYQRNCNSNFSR